MIPTSRSSSRRASSRRSFQPFRSCCFCTARRRRRGGSSSVRSAIGRSPRASPWPRTWRRTSASTTGPCKCRIRGPSPTLSRSERYPRPLWSLRIQDLGIRCPPLPFPFPLLRSRPDQPRPRPRNRLRPLRGPWPGSPRRPRPLRRRLRPNDPAALEMKGDALTNLGRRPEALAAYEGAAALDPKNGNLRQKIEEVRVDVPGLLSRALIASASGNYTQALSLFDDILEVE